MFKLILFIVAVIFVILFAYFFIGNVKEADKIDWGINFSQKHAEQLGLDWKITYLAMLYDLGAKNIKIASYWDLIEPEDGGYSFDDLDWQINAASEKGAKLVVVIGMKSPRWPECHIPGWASGLSKTAQQEKILKLLEGIVTRYNSNEIISAWQIENEPLFNFGLCPWLDRDFLREEVKLVKEIDQRGRPIIISDSGEWSLWLDAAQFGDAVSSTLYRKVRMEQYDRFVTYPFPPIFYWRRADLVKKLFNKEVVIGELQVEPWCEHLLYNCTLEEQANSMDLKQFRENIAFARKTGLSTFYLWGGEWWYWLKEKHANPEIWNEAKTLFLGQQ